MSSIEALDIAPVVPSNIPFLNEALLPFRKEFYGTWAVITFFHDLIGYIENSIDSEEFQGRSKTKWVDFHRWWEDYLTKLREENDSDSDDPESVEVSQILSYLEGRRSIWETLEWHIRYMMLGGPSSSLWEDKGPSYYTVDRGREWLVECALRGLSAATVSPGVQRVAQKNLEALVTCRPKYNLHPHNNPSLGAPVPELFGPGGITWLVMEKFTRDPDDPMRIKVLLEEILRVASTIVGIWTAAHQMEGSPASKMPSFKWYIWGFYGAWHAVRSDVEDDDPETLYRFYIRDGLKDIDF